MKLPYKESFEVGNGFLVELELKDLGPDAPPNFMTDWDRNIDLPTLEIVVLYPIELLKLFDKAQGIPWRLTDYNAIATDHLHSEWGHPVASPDPRASTHRQGANKIKTDDMAIAASQARQSVLNASIRLKAHLDARTKRMKKREETLNKARENLDKPKEQNDSGELRCALVELI